MYNQNQLVLNSPVDDWPEEVKEPTRRLLRKHHPESQVIGVPKDKVHIRNFLEHIGLLSEIEPKHIDNAMSNEYQVKAMQEELDQF